MVGSTALVTTFKTTTGADITMAQTYLPSIAYTGSAYGWAYLTTYSDFASWMSPYSGTPYQMVIGIPMVCQNSDSSHQNTLAQGNTQYATTVGGVNLATNWAAIGANLVAAGFSNAVLRLGWEFDGNWYPWAVANSTDAANFAAYWVNIVTTLRAVSGQNFKFCWGPAGFAAITLSQAVVQDAYPGNSYVDYMTLDLYDWSWDGSIFSGGNPGNTCTTAQSNSLFASFKTMTIGLNWLVTFANSKGKPFGLAECAPTIRDDGHGLGDDPTFVNNAHTWMIANGATVMYWFSGPEDGTANYNLVGGDFPNSLAAFTADFG
jgi:hypothetical protein